MNKILDKLSYYHPLTLSLLFFITIYLTLFVIMTPLFLYADYSLITILLAPLITALISALGPIISFHLKGVYHVAPKK